MNWKDFLFQFTRSKEINCSFVKLLLEVLICSKIIVDVLQQTSSWVSCCGIWFQVRGHTCPVNRMVDIAAIKCNSYTLSPQSTNLGQCNKLDSWPVFKWHSTCFQTSFKIIPEIKLYYTIVSFFHVAKFQIFALFLKCCRHLHSSHLTTTMAFQILVIIIFKISQSLLKL